MPRAWVQPGFWPTFVTAVVLLTVTWCTIPNHEIACVVTALTMPVIVPVMMRGRGARASASGIAMVAMVGGTAGGLIGGIVIRFLCTSSAMGPIMMASMAGMVGGTLSTWGRDR